MAAQDLLPSIYLNDDLDMTAFRQLAYVARNTSADMAKEAARGLPRGRGAALRKKADAAVAAECQALGETLDSAATALSAVAALSHALRLHVADLARGLDPAGAFGAAPAGWAAPLLSDTSFMRNLHGVSAMAEGMVRLADGLPGLRWPDPGEQALWASGVADADAEMLEFLLAAWAGRLAERLPTARLKKAEVDALFERPTTLRRCAGEAGGFPFAVAGDGFLGLPVIVTGIDDEGNVVGFSTAAFVPDLHYAYDDEWRRSQALTTKGAQKGRWTLLEIDPGVLDKALEDFHAMSREPHVARLLDAASPSAAAERLGVSSIKRGIGFVEQTKFGPRVLLDDRFVEALASHAPEMAATRRQTLPPEPPSWNAMEYARKLADKAGILLDDGVFATKKSCSAAIDALKDGREPLAAARKAA